MLREDKDAKKALVMELEEKRRSKDDDLQELQDKIKDFTDLTNQEVLPPSLRQSESETV